MWVFCCGMFRSASTLQFQITSHLVEEYQLGQQIGWIDFKRFSEVRDTYANVPGLKVIKVHHDESSLLHMNHIDSAKAGRWQNDLSESEVELINDRVEKWCLENNYSPSQFLFYNTPALA